jgi:4,4'-diaponeurosporenoate glycosyltransferase
MPLPPPDPRPRKTRLLLVELLRWGAGAWLCWRVPQPRAQEARHDPAAWHGSTLSVVVPARDEEATLGRLLSSLATQTRPAHEVIVIDDGSTDETASVAAAHGAKVLTAGPLPAGWTGKAWACQVGAAAATGTILVFLDADTWLAPDGLERLAGAHACLGGRGLVSVAPYHVIERPYEALSAMCNLVTLMGTGAFTPWGAWARSVGSFGACLVGDRREYLALGGHGAIRGEVVDDLSAVFREVGSPVRLLGGRGCVEYRMYPGGVSQLVEGWTKNLASGAALTGAGVMVAIVAWVSGLISAPWRVLAGGPIGSSVGTYVAYGLQVEWLLRRIGRFGRGLGLAYPLPLAAFLGLCGRSVGLTFGKGQVSWKGRQVAVGR